MLRRLSGRELAELQAVERIDGPQGWRRLDYLAAWICAVIVNCRPFRPKGSAAAKPEDYLIDWDYTEDGPADLDDDGPVEANQEEREARAAELLAALEAIFPRPPAARQLKGTEP